MANNSGEEKTLAPSPKRLQDARNKGQHWHAVDLPVVVALVVALVGIPRYIRWVIPTWETGMQSLWITAATPNNWGHGVVTAGELFARMVVPVTAGFLVVGVLVQVALRGFQFSFHLQFHNPFANVTQWLSIMMLWNLIKGLGKLFGMLGAAGIVLWGERAAFLQLALLPLASGFGRAWDLMAPALWAAVGVFALWGAADAVVQRQKFMQSMKMSHHERKEETKSQEGDPTTRRRRRGIHRQLLRRSLRAVEHAAVVLTNPTHAAVALEWYPTDTQAPRVIAKGWDDVAAAIREEAYRHQVPIVQNPGLARALMTTPLDAPIAEPYWREVSVVLIFILRRRQAAHDRLIASRKES